jgi:hypothetical protein
MRRILTLCAIAGCLVAAAPASTAEAHHWRESTMWTLALNHAHCQKLPIWGCTGQPQPAFSMRTGAHGWQMQVTYVRTKLVPLWQSRACWETQNWTHGHLDSWHRDCN